MLLSFQTITLVCIAFLFDINRADVADTDLNDIEKQINTIPGLEGFNSSQLPKQEDVEKVLREKCVKNGGGEEAYDALVNQGAILKTCLESQLNYTQIQEEIDVAKKTGSMDEVFGKYCKKYPEIYQCVEGATNQTKACLEPKEIESLDKILKVVDELKEFVCFKDGDRIAMFIAEGGIECLESRTEGLQECANKTLGSRIPSDISVSNLPTFLFSDSDCQDFNSIRTCVNQELEKCKDSTPANIVDAFFKFLKKHTPCEASSTLSPLAKAAQTSNSSTTFPTVSLLFLIIFNKFVGFL